MRGWRRLPTARVGRDRIVAAARRLSPDTWALLTIGAVVVLANALYLLDVSDPNPLGPRGGLLSSVALGPAGGQPTIDPNNGFASQALGHLAALNLLNLHLPLWNPYAGTGMPLLGETQSAAFFPPTLLTAISNGQLFEHILFELVAGIATYRLLRRLGVGALAATAGGIAFALNGTFAWFTHATVNPVALLPVLLLGIEHAYDAARAGRHGGWWLLALAGAAGVYAGFPEVTYIDTLMGVAWGLWRCACLPGGRRIAFLVKGGMAALVGVLLAAPMLVAMADYFNHAGLGLHSGGLLGADRLDSQAAAQLVLPYVYGPIFDFSGKAGQLIPLWSSVGGYLSASLILFALAGLAGRGRRGLRIMLAIWGLLVVARMYGAPPLLDHVIGALPGMDNVAFYRYAPAALELTVIVLAAVGLDNLIRRPDRRRWLVCAAVALGVVLAAALEARSMVSLLEPRFGRRPYYAGMVAWAVLVLVAAVLASFLRQPRARAIALTAVLAGDALVMFGIPELSAPRAVSLDLRPVAYLKAHLGTSRFFTLGPLQPNYGSYFGLAELNVNDLIPTRLQDYIHRSLDQIVSPQAFVGNYGGGRSIWLPSPTQELMRNLSGYRAAGVKYVLTQANQPLPAGSPGFSLVYRSPSTLIYALAGARPYFTAAGCSTRPDGRTAVRMACPHPTVLVRRETFFPGWSARVDGRRVPIAPERGVFQSVTVPAGTHTVTFSFTPPNLGWAGLACLAGLGLLGASGLRRRRAASSAPLRS